ncbi:PorP/SprF family type IX secretion system membrane protein [Lentiprolixibacter aurantiacus]|uniref:PorP/SprF family type IX secretion system membrane protein n=1 Tax=Lentiprolixibacter aurantiacus TaxID=2993939 RepID=A0AAE3ML33_9FLAO|nr:PorP/SprF family type IX secretion system membrane protein [Lentiprolixibacter aurantiacus]MCX2719750.1 PorP/SprF family type IX secretion system membrane protein [Lentiprolixibacter aurantiacus]
MKAFKLNPTYCIPLLIMAFSLVTAESNAQETENTANFSSVKSPFHNQLFFNRFLINPTFSLVRENKSYLNILHRNQYASFEDNIQNYYLGFSNKLNERTALGIGLYGQWEGVMQEFGFNANYARAVKLGDKTSLTFGTNITYISQGIDRSKVIAATNDPTLEETGKQSQIVVEPGMALSMGRFDVALYATDLIRYNQTTNNLVTGFNTNNLRAALQYTHPLNARSGLFENGRIMPLLQLGKDQQDRLAYIGSLLLDLPNYGWLQTTYDETYGLSLGMGFNLNRRLSIGYLMEKDITETGGNLGWNHELSLAYTFKDEDANSDGYASNSKDRQIDQIVRNYEEQILQLKAQQDKATTATTIVDESDLAMENRLILDELILRQDSIERARDVQFEKKFEMLVRLIRKEIRDGAPAPPGPVTKEHKIPTALAQTAPVKTRSSRPTKRDFKELPIRSKNRSDIVGVSSGYYLIANVYKNKKYLDAFLKTLNQKGLNAKQFYNTENGLYYVYLADFNTKDDAKMAFVNNLDGQYRDEKWIMEVYNPVASASVEFND